MHPFSESIRKPSENQSANYGNIKAKNEEREKIARDVAAFIDAGGKIEVLPSFDCSVFKVPTMQNMGVVL